MDPSLESMVSAQPSSSESPSFQMGVHSEMADVNEKGAVAGLRTEDVSVVLINGRKTVIAEDRLAAIEHGYIVLDSDPVLLAAAGIVTTEAIPVFELVDAGVDGGVEEPISVWAPEIDWQPNPEAFDSEEPQSVVGDELVAEMFRLRTVSTHPDVQPPMVHAPELTTAEMIEPSIELTNTAEDEGEPAQRNGSSWDTESIPPVVDSSADTGEVAEAVEAVGAGAIVEAVSIAEIPEQLVAALPVVPPVLSIETTDAAAFEPAIVWPVIEAAPVRIPSPTTEHAIRVPVADDFVDDDGPIVWPVIFDQPDVPSWAVLAEPQTAGRATELRSDAAQTAGRATELRSDAAQTAQILAFPGTANATQVTVEETFDTAFGSVSIAVPTAQPVPTTESVPTAQPDPTAQRTMQLPTESGNLSSESVPAISVSGLVRNINGPHGRISVLAGVTFDLAPGDLFVLRSSTGAGTTTLMNCLAGLDDVDAGRISINGEEMKGWSDSDRTRFRAAAAGIVSQDLDLIDDLSAVENTTLPLLAAGWSGPAAVSEAQRLLAILGLADRGTHLPNQLSRGERQRVAVARALVGDPLVIWADDPTSSLDAVQGQLVIDALIGHHRRGATVFVASRDQRFAVPGSRCATLSNGILTHAAEPRSDVATPGQAAELRSDFSSD